VQGSTCEREKKGRKNFDPKIGKQTGKTEREGDLFGHEGHTRRTVSYYACQGEVRMLGYWGVKVGNEEGEKRKGATGTMKKLWGTKVRPNEILTRKGGISRRIKKRKES